MAKIDLMGVSALWDEFVQRHGEEGIGAAGLEEILRNGADALEYVDRMAKVFRETLIVGRGDDVGKAVADVSRFVLLMYVLSIVKSRETGRKMANDEPDFYKVFEKLLRSLQNDTYRHLLESIVSTSVMVGVGIAIDEGFSKEKPVEDGE